MNFRKSSCTLFAATALALAGCGESDSTTTYTNPVPDLLITIGQQERKAFSAKTSADMSLKDATTKATMLSAVKVKGESSVAEANAQAILDAKGKVDSALTEANAALTALQEAKTEADALPADTPKLEELKAELAKAITEATAHRAAIQALKDATGNDSLAKLVEKVTGTGDKKKTPVDIAAAVAVEVEKAMAFPVKGTSRYPAITGGVPDAKTAYFLVDGKNIVSTGELLDEYDGMTLKNLPGVRLEQTDYADYGYWIAIPNDSQTIAETQIFGVPKNNQAAPVATVAADPALGNTFTYSGKALGMSVLTERDGRKRKAIKSGEFTADVKLTATFAGSDSKVKGSINNFQGNAIGEDWSVQLKEAPLVTSVDFILSDQNAPAIGKGNSSDPGEWYARANLSTVADREKQRPAGISGVFQVFFKDGRAVGGYATVKDE